MRWNNTSHRRSTLSAHALNGAILQNTSSTSAVSVHTVAATTGALVLRNHPASPTAKHSQPRIARVTTLFGLSFMALRIGTALRTTFQSLPLRSEFSWYREMESRCALICAESTAAPFQRG